jgi:uncharacterized membrane protein YhaH (DUF805 family)
MIRFQKPRRENRANKVFPSLMAHWFAYCLFRIDGNRLHLSGMDSVLAITMGIPTGVAWLVFMPPRLRDLGLSRLWMLPFAVPFIIAILAIWKSLHTVCWVSLAIAASIQWSLVFLVPPGAPLSDGIEESDGQIP